MTAAEASSIAWTRAKLSLPGHESWVKPFATWGLSHRPAGVKSVVNCHFDEERMAEQVEEILRCFQDAEEPANWMLGPSASPDHLSKYLRRERRFMGPMFLDGMELNLAEWNPQPGVGSAKRLDCVDERHPSLTWHPKGHRADALLILKELCAARLAQIFGSEIDGQPAGAVTLFMSDGIAGIYDVVTHPDLRGQGAATAVLTQALLFARENGCRVAALQSHSKAVGLYARLGFEKTGTFKSMYYSRVRLALDRDQRA